MGLHHARHVVFVVGVEVCRFQRRLTSTCPPRATAQTTLDVAYEFEVLFQLVSIVGSELPVKKVELGLDRVEHGGSLIGGIVWIDGVRNEVGEQSLVDLRR